MGVIHQSEQKHNMVLCFKNRRREIETVGRKTTDHTVNPHSSMVTKETGDLLGRDENILKKKKTLHSVLYSPDYDTN